MLILNREKNESIMIGDNIEIVILGLLIKDMKGNYVKTKAIGCRIKIGIKAPKNIPVHRREVYDAIQKETRA